MIRILCLLLFLHGWVFAQDVIVRGDGSKIRCEIVKEDSLNIYFKAGDRGREISTFIDKGDVRAVRRAPPEDTLPARPEYIGGGFGLGMDYGGYGLKAISFPHPNIGLFAGGGYNLEGFGYNAGLKLRLAFKKRFVKTIPYLTGMYGFNTVIKIENADYLNKVFYGLTLGGGFDFRSGRTSSTYFSVGILFPVRGEEVDRYMNELIYYHNVKFKGSLPPIGLSIGFMLY